MQINKSLYTITNNTTTMTTHKAGNYNILGVQKSPLENAFTVYGSLSTRSEATDPNCDSAKYLVNEDSVALKDRFSKTSPDGNSEIKDK